MPTVTLYPIADGSMDQDSPTTVGATGSFIATGFFSTPQTNRGLVEFDISGIPLDATINSAELKLTVDSNFLGTSHTLNIYRVRRNWRRTSGAPVANTASWNNYHQGLGLAWSTAGAGHTTNDRDSATIGTLAVTAATSGTQTITLGASQVEEWIDGTFPCFGVLLQATVESGSNTLMRWKPKSDATPANRPQLIIDYTAPSHAITEDLLCYHTLDDTSGTDASGSGHTLTLTNSPTSVTGKLANAMHFVAASSQYASNNDAALKLGDVDWTWCGWVKLTNKTDIYAAVANGEDTAPSGGFKFFYHDVDILDFWVAQLFSADAADDPVISDVVAINAGSPTAGVWEFRNWFHIISNRSGSWTEDSAGGHWESVNYGPYDPTTVHGASTAPSDPYTLGRGRSSGVQEHMNGDIDEVGFWGRWLSLTEIQFVHDAVVAGRSPIAQLVYPSADVSDGSWTNELGSAVNLYASLDESTASDADYIQSSVNPSSDAAELALGTLSAPAVDTGHVLRYRIKRG
jgi:hypothetical protein